MTWKVLILVFIFSISLGYVWGLRKHQTALRVTQKPAYQPKVPSLDQIFSDNHTWISALDVKRLRIVIATGDIILARAVNFETLKHKDFNWPYLNTYQTTKDSDITFANLESPEIKNCQPTNQGMIFCGDEKNIQGLKFAGIDVVSLANNHAGNYGEEGVKETINHLTAAGIDSTGTIFSNLVIKDIRGIKFAFLGFNDITKDQPGVSNVDEEKIKNEIAQAKRQANIVIVTMHWGVEYQDQPDNRQRYLGQLVIDAGADLVIGNHPHWIQPVEIYKDKLITYAHGNFIFDQEWSLKTKQGVIGKYTFYDNKLIDIEFLPIQIENYGQPILLTGDEKKEILESMKKQSIRLNDTHN